VPLSIHLFPQFVLVGAARCTFWSIVRLDVIPRSSIVAFATVVAITIKLSHAFFFFAFRAPTFSILLNEQFPLSALLRTPCLH